MTIHNLENTGECRQDEFGFTGLAGEPFAHVRLTLDCLGPLSKGIAGLLSPIWLLCCSAGLPLLEAENRLCGVAWLIESQDSRVGCSRFFIKHEKMTFIVQIETLNATYMPG